MKKTIFYLFLIGLPNIGCKENVETPATSSTQIISFSPTSGSIGTEITIVGKNFTEVKTVSFGSETASTFNVVNTSTITAVVGKGSSGEIKVVSPNGSASLSGFNYIMPPAPIITSVNHHTGTINSNITITGTNFTWTTAVSFGGVPASSFTIVNATTINAVIGTGGSGNIVVTTLGGSATLAGFVYTDTVLSACKIKDTFKNSSITIGFSDRPYRVQSFGKVKVGILFVDYYDAAATKTPKEIYDTYISPFAEDYLKAVSYDKLNLEFESTFEWFRMGKSASSYTFATYSGHRDYIEEAILLANYKVDFSKYGALLIINDPSNSPSANGPAFSSNNPSNGIPVDGTIINNVATSGRDLRAWAKGLWFCHEFGHNLGLIDLYRYGNISGHAYVGDYSIMGNIAGLAPEYLGWERWLLGWLNENQVVCQSDVGNGSVTLSPIETKGGIKLLTIPIDQNSTMVVESRRKLGYDKTLVKEGPLVYVVDASLASGNGAIKVLPITETDDKKLQAPMNVSQSLTYKNITITYTSKGNDGDLITFEKK